MFLYITKKLDKMDIRIECFYEHKNLKTFMSMAFDQDFGWKLLCMDDLWDDHIVVLRRTHNIWKEMQDLTRFIDVMIDIKNTGDIELKTTVEKINEMIKNVKEF